MGAASMDRGWVKVWRSLRGSALAKRGPAWELLMIHLVMDAEWQGPARGTLTVSVRDYARREGLSYKQIRLMLDEMAADGFIALETVGGVTRHRRTLVRILKYADYQGDIGDITEPETDGAQSGSQSGAQSGTQSEADISNTYDVQGAQSGAQYGAQYGAQPLTTTEEEFNKSLPLNAPAHVREEPPPSGWLPSGAPPGLEAYPTRPEEVEEAAELLGASLDAGEAERFLLHWQERCWTLPDGARVRSWRTSLAKWLRNPRRAYFNGEFDGQRGNQGSNGMAARWSEERRKRVGGDPGDYYARSDVEWLRRQGILPG